MNISGSAIDSEKIISICDTLDDCTDGELAFLFDNYFVRFAKTTTLATLQVLGMDDETINKGMSMFDELLTECCVDEL